MKNSNTTGKSETDWAKIDAMKDVEIDFSDNPKVAPEMFARGVLRNRSKTNVQSEQETLTVDRDVIEFFKSQGQNYQTKINQLLRAHMEAEQAK